MRTIMISKDPELLMLKDNASLISDEPIKVCDESNDPLDVMSTVCEQNPSILIIDDDFLHPETVHVLKSIRKVNKSIKIIFVTSNASIDLGKEISPLGIYYYAIKPLDTNELLDSFQAVVKEHNKETLNV